MPKIYDESDLFWTSLGDFHLGGDGDLQDTEHDPLRSLVQEIKTRVEADQGDWENFPDLRAAIGDFVGQPNNKQTAESIKTRIIAALTQDGFVHSKDLKVMYVPINVDHLLYRISIQVAPTVRNRNSSQLIYNLLYSYSDNNVYFVR